MFQKRAAVAVVSLACLVSCGRRPPEPVQDLGGGGTVSAFVLKSLRGTRDGTRLQVEATYGDESQKLLVRLQFEVNPQARLESGMWTGPAGEGPVRERSVTFLGGQSGRPSIGGTFDLVGRDDRALYRVTIPLQPLKDPL